MVHPIPYSDFAGKTALSDRFIRYALIPTASDPSGSPSPSTAKQLVLARLLRGELEEMGLLEVKLSEFGIVSATLPATPDAQGAPVMALLAHMDTSPEASDEAITPQVAPCWDGSPVMLTPEGTIRLSAEMFPELLPHRGEDL